MFDASGMLKTADSARASSNSNNADQTANAADTYLTGGNLSIAGRLQTITRMHWLVTATKTAAGIATPIWNVRFGTAGSTADTTRLTFTGLARLDRAVGNPRRGRVGRRQDRHRHLGPRRCCRA
jgi:hypothetical protein